MDKEQTAMERLRLASDMSLRLYHQPQQSRIHPHRPEENNATEQ